MQRLNNIAKELVHPLDYLKLSSLIEPEYRSLLQKVEEFCQKHLHTEQFLECYEKAEFPYYLLPLIAELNIAQYFVPAPYGKELPLMVQGLLVATIAAHDLCISTFLFLQLPLSARTISLLGSQSQKKEIIPELMSLKKICGWALTEREVGSNSTRLGTNFEKRGDGYILNGNKRWIGNGVNDYLIVYGNMKGQGRVVGAILKGKAKGLSAEKIPNKYSFRMVQNAQIEFQNVSVAESQFLPGATSYKAGVEDIIGHSRLIIIWNTVGACIGVYNVALKEATQRKQFGKTIASFQLIQERLVKMMGQIQAMLLAAWRLTELAQKKSLEMATVGMFKAWVTSRGRIIGALGRQIMGSRGMAGDCLMKKLLDLQIPYTYEGSYEMNTLLAGSQLTGIKAFI